MPQPTNDYKQIKLRRNIGPPCPLCDMPGTQYGTRQGNQAKYRCEGFNDIEAGLQYAGCGHTWRRAVWTPSAMLNLMTTEGPEALQQVLVDQIAEPDRIRAAILKHRQLVSDSGPPAQNEPIS